MSEVTIFLNGKAYTVPSGLTVMQALETVGLYSPHRHSCGTGVCGACAFLYCLNGKRRGGLACQTPVIDGMEILELPSARTTAPSTEPVACHSCGLCNLVCPQQLPVQSFVAAARDGNVRRCAELSFLCVGCGLCAARCPAGINPAQTALRIRRALGRSLPLPPHSEDEAALQVLLESPLDAVKAAYETRDFEP